MSIFWVGQLDRVNIYEIFCSHMCDHAEHEPSITIGCPKELAMYLFMVIRHIVDAGS